MESRTPEELGPDLQTATVVLRHALAEACGTEIKQANTGELRRVQEVLVVASEAAGQIVSMRRARHERRASRESHHASDAAGESPRPHRVFVDGAGVIWDAFAVYPSSDTGGKARLPEPYQRGWLSFDSGAERRRLSPIPDEWHGASDDALARMCARAEPAARRARSSHSSERSPD